MSYDRINVVMMPGVQHGRAYLLPRDLADKMRSAVVATALGQPEASKLVADVEAEIARRASECAVLDNLPPAPEGT